MTDQRALDEAIERLGRWERAACYPGVDHAEVRRDLQVVLAAHAATPLADTAAPSTREQLLHDLRSCPVAGQCDRCDEIVAAFEGTVRADERHRAERPA